MDAPRHNLRYVSFLAAVAALGGFLFGYDTAVISGTISQVTRFFALDTLEVGWYVGCALVGSILGGLTAGVVADFAGRKRAMLLSALLFTASAAGCALCGSFRELVFYRLIGGIGIGIASIVSPLYISEVSVARYRGSLVSLYQLAITVGFLGAYLANYLLLTHAAAHAAPANPLWAKLFSTELWRGMLGLETLPAVLFFGILFFIPESPRYLILRGRHEAALAILRRIYREASEAAAEAEATRQAVGTARGSEWSALRHPGIFRALAVGVAIALLGQFMGVNAVLYYGPTIFEQSGLSGGDSLLYQVLVGSVNMLTTVLALVIIDRVGRKKLVYYGVGSMIVSLLLIAAYFSWGARLGIANVVLLLLFLLYIFSCAISICAVIWVLLSEMYPIRVRGIAMSIAGLALWIGTYLVGQLTPWLLDALTPAGTFTLFAAVCIPYILIVWRLVPETTGRPLEEIERHWTARKQPITNR